MNENFIPIETEVGIISGRDAIYLDEIKFDYKNNKLIFLGEINNSLCSKRIKEKKWLSYSLTFLGVLNFQMIELDFADFRGKSSFDLVDNSKWLNEFKINNFTNKLKPNHKHYLMQTYDDIFEIICESFELEMLSLR